jgi:hypothetical protein
MKFFLKNLPALLVGVGACAGGWYMGKSAMTELETVQEKFKES